ncbi:hypothetical protein Taro_046555 [Colocasia esculenta]|uniref:R13L1/DRL21-like LRR repeat region domain-containing protein n=1 Tax=Colocasia esculenta TaxID=4460 RepID=A0A843WZE7_COLES|nr:hypothetical protein [Colocasia esculenta]
MEHLRVLDLGGVHRDLLVESITHLKHLRYLRISNIVQQLPEFVGTHLYTAAPVEDQPPCLQLEAAGQREAEYILSVWYHICQLTVKGCSNLTSLPFGFSHLIRRLTITECANLTSLPWTDLITLEYLMISECPLFQLLDAEQLPPTLQVLYIYANTYETGQCSRHQHFQRLKQVQQCSNEEGADQNLYLVFRNVRDACGAADFCSKTYLQIRTLEIEWDCCTNDKFKVVDSAAEEVLGKLYRPLGGFGYKILNLDKLVIQGYTGSRFAGSFSDRRLPWLRSVSLQQCSNCEILPPLGQLYFLEEIFVEGASSLESFAQDYDISKQGRQETRTDIAFPSLQKLEFRNMPVWKEWLGTKEGDFPRLRKLILKHCPKLRALPHLPPRLKELELEACHELTSLSIFDSRNHATSLISLKPLRWLSLSTTKGTSPILRHMSLTNCPLLLALCEEHPRILAGIPNLLIDGVRVHTKHEKSIRSQIKSIRENGGVSMHDED